MRFFKALPLLVALAACALAQDWSDATDGTFTVLTASPEDAFHLPQIFGILTQAKRDLRSLWNLELPEGVTVIVHPTLESFMNATSAPWYVAGLTDREVYTVHLQRLRVLLERGSLERTLRHELFHLAQPQSWPRWLAEGSAMLFAGEQPQAPPYAGLSEEELDLLLATARTQASLVKAAATAYEWAQHHWRQERRR